MDERPDDARGAWRAYSRELRLSGGLKAWVVPSLPCDGAVSGEEDACLVALRGAQRLAVLCGGVAARRSVGERVPGSNPVRVEPRTAFVTFVAGGRLGVAGFAPPGADQALVRVRGLRPVSATVDDGVFAALLTGVGSADAAGQVEVEPGYVPPTVVVRDASASPDEARRVLERAGVLGYRYLERIRAVPSRATSRVLYEFGEDRRDAELLAFALRSERVGRGRRNAIMRGGPGRLTVEVGRDAAR